MTKKTQWSKPEKIATSVNVTASTTKVTFASNNDDNLPEGWEKKWAAAQGKYYYVNHITKKTQWQCPTKEESQSTISTDTQNASTTKQTTQPTSATNLGLSKSYNYLLAEKFDDELKRHFNRLDSSKSYESYIKELKNSDNKFSNIYKKAQNSKATQDELNTSKNIFSAHAKIEKTASQRRQADDQASRLLAAYLAFEDDLLKNLNHKTFDQVFQHVASIEYRTVVTNKTPLTEHKFKFVLKEIRKYIERGKVDYERNKQRLELELAAEMKLEKEKEAARKKSKLEEEKRKADEQLSKLKSKYMVSSISIKGNKPTFIELANEKFFNVAMTLENGKPVTDRLLEKTLDTITNFVEDAVEKENNQKEDLFSKPSLVKVVKKKNPIDKKPRKTRPDREKKVFDKSYLTNVKQHGKVNRLQPIGPTIKSVRCSQAVGADSTLVNGSVGSVYHDLIGSNLVKRCVANGPRDYNVGDRVTAVGPKGGFW